LGGVFFCGCGVRGGFFFLWGGAGRGGGGGVGGVFGGGGGVFFLPLLPAPRGNSSRGGPEGISCLRYLERKKSRGEVRYSPLSLTSTCTSRRGEKRNADLKEALGERSVLNVRGEDQIRQKRKRKRKTSSRRCPGILATPGHEMDRGEGATSESRRRVPRLPEWEG